MFLIKEEHEARIVFLHEKDVYVNEDYAQLLLAM